MVETAFDHLLWCEDCESEQTKQCVNHGGYTRIKDKLIPSRARLTAPHQVNIKLIELTADTSDEYGVFAKKVIQKRTMLGPYEGKLTETWKHERGDRIILKLFLKKTNSMYLDCSDEAFCNWMMFVRPALDKEEQNLVAFQHQGSVYFATTRAVRINEELKVWYGKGYEHLLTISHVPITCREQPAPTPPDSENEGVFKQVEILEPTKRGGRRKGLRRNKKNVSPEDEPLNTNFTVINIVPGVERTEQVEITCIQQPNVLDSDNEIHSFDPFENMELENSVPETSQLETDAALQSTVIGRDSVIQANIESNVAFDTISEPCITNETVNNTTIDIMPNQNTVIEEFITKSRSKRQTKSKSKGKQTRKLKGTKYKGKDIIPESNSASPKPIPNENLIDTDIDSIPLLNVEIVTQPVDTDSINKISGLQNSQETTIIMLETPTETATQTESENKSPKTPTVVSKLSKRRRRGKSKPEDKEDKMAPKQTFDCQLCEKVFSAESQYWTHMLEHTGALPFACKEEGCGKRFISAFKLKRHMTIHGKGTKFNCPYCNKLFGRKDHLKSHLRVHSLNKDVYNCTQCGKTYQSPYAFKLHSAFHKAEGGDLACFVCHKEFDDNPSIMRHLKMHAGSHQVKNETDKRHECQFCKKKFFAKKDMERHLVTHTKEREFMCHHCPARFGRPDHLVRHMNSGHHKAKKSKAKVQATGEDVGYVTNRRRGLRRRKSQKLLTELPKIEKITPVEHIKILNNDSNIVVYEIDGSKLRVTDSLVMDPDHTISITALSSADQNFTVLQPAQTQAISKQASLASQKTLQIPSLVANETDLSMIQNPCQSLATDSDVTSFFAFLNSTTNKSNTTSELPNLGKPIVSGKIPIKPIKRQRIPKKPIRGRGAKRRQSPSRSSLTSQPTVNVKLLPGTSHLTGSLLQSNTSTSHVIPTQNQAANQMPINISNIDQINLEALFGDKVKSMQRNVQLQLQRELQSLMVKNVAVSSAQSTRAQSPLQVFGQVLSVNPSANVMPSLQYTGNNIQPIQAVNTNQIPLTTIDTQALIQHLLDVEPGIVTISQTQTTNTIPTPQNTQFLQLVEPNVNPNPVLPIHTLQIPHKGFNMPAVALKSEVNVSNRIDSTHTPVTLQSADDAQANQSILLTVPDTWKLILSNDHPSAQN